MEAWSISISCGYESCFTEYEGLDVSSLIMPPFPWYARPELRILGHLAVLVLRPLHSISYNDCTWAEIRKEICKSF